MAQKSTTTVADSSISTTDLSHNSVVETIMSTKATIQSGTVVQTRKSPHTRGVVKKVEGKRKYTVEWEGDDGETWIEQGVALGKIQRAKDETAAESKEEPKRRVTRSNKASSKDGVSQSQPKVETVSDDDESKDGSFGNKSGDSSSSGDTETPVVLLKQKAKKPAPKPAPKLTPKPAPVQSSPQKPAAKPPSSSKKPAAVAVKQPAGVKMPSSSKKPAARTPPKPPSSAKKPAARTPLGAAIKTAQAVARAAGLGSYKSPAPKLDDDWFPAEDDSSFSDFGFIKTNESEDTLVTAESDGYVHVEPGDEDLPDAVMDEKEAAFEANNVEKEKKYKQRLDRYKTEHEQLLEDGFEVVLTATSSGVDIGSVVETRKQPRRRGEVVGKAEDGPWLVLFSDSEEEEPMRGQQLVVVAEGQAIEYSWKIEREVSVVYGVTEYGAIGQSDVKFDLFAPPDTAGPKKAVPTEGMPKDVDFPYWKLVQDIWPGDPEAQRLQLNLKIREHNLKEKLPKNRVIKDVTFNEWWKFIGILASAAPQGKGGINLWEKRNEDSRLVSAAVNYGPRGSDVMALHRFKDIKRFFPFAFEDKEATHQGDPWSMIRLLSDGFNKKRQETFAASSTKVLDETMSAWRPQTTKEGGLPNISYILRKPEPLGTEFKTVCCAESGTVYAPSVPSTCRPSIEIETVD